METPLGLILQQWRKGRGLSCRGLAAKIGLSHSTIVRWEKDEQLPRRPELEMWLAEMRASPAQRQTLLKQWGMHPRIHLLPRTDLAQPVSGDLLRTLRMRCGKTQAEVAKAVGVQQGTLAKWESSEDWPSLERLHALCYRLNASLEEMVALTTGIFTVSDGLEQFEDPETQIRQELNEVVHGGVHRDLRFLKLEMAVFDRLALSPLYEEMLLLIYSGHARYLCDYKRFQEAKRYLHHVSSSNTFARYKPEIWQNAALAQLISSIHYGRRPAQIADIVATYRPQVDPAYQAWIDSEMALYGAQQRDEEAALQFSQSALKTTQLAGLETEFSCRRLDQVMVLNQFNHSEHALDILDSSDDGDPNRPGVRLNHLIPRMHVLASLRKHDDVVALSRTAETHLQALAPWDARGPMFRMRIDSLLFKVPG